MELLIGLIVLGLVLVWYWNNKKKDIPSQLEVEVKAEAAHYKVETPAPVVTEETPAPAEVVEAPAKKTRKPRAPKAEGAVAKKAAAKKTAAKKTAKSKKA